MGGERNKKYKEKQKTGKVMRWSADAKMKVKVNRMSTEDKLQERRHVIPALIHPVYLFESIRDIIHQ